MNKKLIVIASVLLTLLFLSSCSASQKIYMCEDGSIAGKQQITEKNVVFVCPNGREVPILDQCTFTLPITITAKDAEQKAVSFVQGHVQAKGWTTTLVSVYREEDAYYAQLVLSKHNESAYQTIIKIDGTKGIVSCSENCDYLS